MKKIDPYLLFFYFSRSNLLQATSPIVVLHTVFNYQTSLKISPTMSMSDFGLHAAIFSTSFHYRTKICYFLNNILPTDSCPRYMFYQYKLLVFCSVLYSTSHTISLPFYPYRYLLLLKSLLNFCVNCQYQQFTIMTISIQFYANLS